MVRLATRERVATALDADHSAYRGAQIDQALDAATDTIALALDWADIAPVVATRYFDWPPRQMSRAWRLDLHNHGCISVTTVVAGGTTITSDVQLEPVNDGPPFTSLEIDRASSASFGGADSPQRAVAVTGLWGLGDTQAPAGVLASSPNDSTTTIDGTDGRVGVGAYLLIGSERVTVDDRTYLDTGANLSGDMDESDADTLLVPSAGTWFAGERLILDAEAMDVKAVTAAGLIVERAVDGTVLAAHTGAVDIYAARRWTVTRGAGGTTAASHTAGDPVTVWRPPPVLEALGVAVAMDQVEQEMGAYSRNVRGPDSAGDATGTGLAAAWARALQAYGRRGSRMATV
jgi:hypothetical protein